MKFITLFALAVALLAGIFALQNAGPIVVRFFAWEAEGSMALVLLLTFALGVVFGLLVSVPAMIRRMRHATLLRRKVDQLTVELNSLSQGLTPQAPAPPAEADLH